jgi:hypothetical protein
MIKSSLNDPRTNQQQLKTYISHSQREQFNYTEQNSAVIIQSQFV